MVVISQTYGLTQLELDHVLLASTIAPCVVRGTITSKIPHVSEKE